MPLPSVLGTISKGQIAANAQLTVSHTVAAGTSKILLVSVQIEDSVPRAAHVQTVTFNGVNLTQVHPRVAADETPNTIILETWYLLNPAEVTADVVCDTNEMPGTMALAAITIQDAKQATPDPTDSSIDIGTPTAISTTLNDIAANSLLIDSLGININTDPTIDAGQTELWDEPVPIGGLSRHAGSSEPETVGGSETMGWTFASAGRVAHVIIAIREPKGGPPSFILHNNQRGRIWLWPGQPFLHHNVVPAAAGDIIITPAASSAVAAKVDPVVVLGSMSFTPAVITAVAGKVDPTVLLGSLSLTPAVAAAVAGIVDPTVSLGSLSITPTTADGIAGNVDPVVVFGSLVIIPAVASAVAGIVDPTVIEGGIIVIPAVASAVAGNVDPTVVLGSMVFTPTDANAVGGKVDPAVVLGTLSIGPTPASAIAGIADPTVVIGTGDELVVPTPAFAIAGKVDPTAILGSLVITPVVLTAVGTTINPTVVIPAGGARRARYDLRRALTRRL